jgi:hypothetical protein
MAEPHTRSELFSVHLRCTSVEGIGPTAELKRVVERAFQLVDHPQSIGTEHLLLAIAGGEVIARAVLDGLAVSDQAIRAEISRSRPTEE